MGEECCLRRNQRRAARAAWVRCGPSTSRSNSRTDELAGSSRRRVQPFLLNHCSSEQNRTCLPGLIWSSSREGATRSVRAARWAKTRNCSRSPNLASNSNESGPPLPSSRAAYWEGPRWSPPLVSDIVISEAVQGHWTKKITKGRAAFADKRCAPLGLRQPSALESDLRWGKILLAFRFWIRQSQKRQKPMVNPIEGFGLI